LFCEIMLKRTVRSLAADVSQGLAGRLSNNFARIFRLRALLKELCPDVIVAFMTEANVVALCSTRGLVLISEFADGLVLQTEGIAAWAKARFNIPIHVIPNPVLLELDGAAIVRGPHLLVWLGRLSHQKGYDLLLKSFAALAGKHPDWQLIVYGDGPERARLERLQAQSGHAEQISLPGLARDSLGVLRQASLFVLPSRFEGYPTPSLKRWAVGFPSSLRTAPAAPPRSWLVASTACSCPRRCYRMTAALDAMMSASHLRKAYAARARRAVTGLDVAIEGKRWLDLLAALKA
jgi:glycosyltransferase involved in cell wall biosynthesis